jgi:hypothetical protein
VKVPGNFFALSYILSAKLHPTFANNKQLLVAGWKDRKLQTALGFGFYSVQ